MLRCRCRLMLRYLLTIITLTLLITILTSRNVTNIGNNRSWNSEFEKVANFTSTGAAYFERHFNHGRRILPNFYTSRDYQNDRRWPPDDHYRNGSIVYLHHHKAAGSTVRTCISNMKPSISLKTVSHESYSQIFQSLKSNDSFVFDMYVGGYTYGICDYISNRRPCSYFTVLRHPFDRVISAYEYCKRYTQDHICWGKSAKTMSLKDWVNFHSSFFFYQLLFQSEFCENKGYYVARQLSNSGRLLPCWYVQRLIIDSKTSNDVKTFLLDYILDHLEQMFAVIGLVEQFETSLRLLEDVYDLPFVWCHSMKLKDSSLEDKRSTVWTMKRQLETDLEITNILYYDLEIYKRSQKIFEKQKRVFYLREVV
ncbi:uncharacterized protein LOC144355255 [Saccoglossus kowalevskii]